VGKIQENFRMDSSCLEKKKKLINIGPEIISFWVIKIFVIQNFVLSSLLRSPFTGINNVFQVRRPVFALARCIILILVYNSILFYVLLQSKNSRTAFISSRQTIYMCNHYYFHIGTTIFDISVSLHDNWFICVYNTERFVVLLFAERRFSRWPIQQSKERIKFCVSNEINATKTFEMLQKAFGDKCLSRSRTFEWYKRVRQSHSKISYAHSLLRLS